MILTRLYRKIREMAWKISLAGLERGPHITRYFMYDRLARIGPLLPNRTGRILSISHSANLGELLGLRPTKLDEANYPEHDMLALKSPDAHYDFVLSDQVLEHLEGSPQQGIDECHRVLKPGGIAVHTTCFINPIHGSPNDFWRFTPEALRWLHRGWAEVMECDGWGSFAVWSVVHDGLRFEGVPHARWHPLHRLATRNDPLWPIVTWVVARK